MKSRKMRRAGHIARMEMRNTDRTLVGKPEGNKPHGRPRRRKVDNIKMNRISSRVVHSWRQVLNSMKFIIISIIIEMNSEGIHNVLLFAKYNENDEVKEDEIDRASRMNGEKRNTYRTEEERPLGRPRRRKVDNIKIDFRRS
jgi:hypothetical protein